MCKNKYNTLLKLILKLLFYLIIFLIIHINYSLLAILIHYIHFIILKDFAHFSPHIICVLFFLVICYCHHSPVSFKSQGWFEHYYVLYYLSFLNVSTSSTLHTPFTLFKPLYFDFQSHVLISASSWMTKLH